jgi:hypothetical protein
VAGGRPRLAARIRQELDALLDQLEGYRQAKRPRDARDCAITLGILVDKWMALERREAGSGGQVDPVVAVARLGHLLDVAEQREGTSDG